MSTGVGAHTLDFGPLVECKDPDVVVALFLGHSQILSCSCGDKIWEWLGTEASVVVFEAQDYYQKY